MYIRKGIDYDKTRSRIVHLSTAAIAMKEAHHEDQSKVS
jgi:hypothetical protein